MTMTARRRASAAVAILRVVHRQPGIERAALARELTMTSGLITETMARLSSLDLLSERPAPRTGARGRPTTTLQPHPRGPLAIAVAIGHETWRTAVAQLGGAELARTERAHQRGPAEGLAALAPGLRAPRGPPRPRPCDPCAAATGCASGRSPYPSPAPCATAAWPGPPPSAGVRSTCRCC